MSQETNVVKQKSRSSLIREYNQLTSSYESQCQNVERLKEIEDLLEATRKKTNKELVLVKYPKAIAEKQIIGIETYWTIKLEPKMMYTSFGKTSAEAWKNALFRIESREQTI